MMTRSKTRAERKRELDEEIAKAADRRRKTGKESSSTQHEEKSQSTLEVKMMTRSKTRAERKRNLEEEIAKAADRRETGKESSGSTQHEEKSLTVNPLLDRYLHRGTLLPGIPDDVTTQVLSTVLPWNAFHTLSSVSNAWHKSIQSGEMSEARVRFNSTDKLAVIKYCLQKGKTYGIAVYSFRDKAFYPLPQIPGIESGIPERCKCTTLDGKIYILGGVSRDLSKTRSGKIRYESSDVYMLDVVGHRPWKKCASMQAAGWRFGCGIIDGKIYVCGGSPHRTRVNLLEVYDPQEDAWTEVEPMPDWGTKHEFAVVENELWVFGVLASRRVGFWQPVLETCVQIYNPTRDEWRRLPPSPGSRRFGLRFFMAKGKLHSMTSSEIFVHDLETNSRTLLHTVSKKIDGPAPQLYLSGPIAVAAIDDELLAIHSAGDYSVSELRAVMISGRHCIWPIVVQSRGFGVRDKEIIWERVECSLDLEGLWPQFICPLRL
ncbi:unnamed protein product [Calypogeia fissa]